MLADFFRPFRTDVLVCPTRPTPRLTDLRADELAELMCAVQRVGRVVERMYKADGLTIACQVRYRTTAFRRPLSCSLFLFLFLLLMFEGESVTQDGVAAGQTVPHVHFHLLPRRLQGDRFAGSRNDEIFNELEKQEGTLPQDLTAASDSHTRPGLPEPLRVDADAMREPRTLEDMEQEAKWLAGFFEAEE